MLKIMQKLGNDDSKGGLNLSLIIVIIFISHAFIIASEAKMEMSVFIGLLVRSMICSNSACGIDKRFIVPQGMIEMDSEFAKTIGFISTRFLSCSYLWGEGNRIIIRTIECTDRRRGYLRELFKSIWDLGVEIAVRTPLSAMKEILVHYGFKETTVQDPIYGKVELWVK